MPSIRDSAKPVRLRRRIAPNPAAGAASVGRLARQAFLRELALGLAPDGPIPQELSGDRVLGAIAERGLIALHIGVDAYRRERAGAETRPGAELPRAEHALREALDASRLVGELFAGSEGEWTLLLGLEPGGPDGLDGSDSSDSSDSVLPIAEWADRLIEAVRLRTGIGITIGLGRPVPRLSALRLACREAERAYRSKWFAGCGRTIRPDPGDAVSAAEPPPFDIRPLERAVYAKKGREAKQLVRHLLSQAAVARDVPLSRMVALELLHRLNALEAELTEDAQAAAERKKARYAAWRLLETAAEATEWLAAEYDALIGALKGAAVDGRDSVQRAVAYMEARFAEELSLQTISDSVYLSKNYFANLFKRETGESFVEYLTRIRVEEAKRMLREEGRKTADIGERVGIRDAKYFAKVFKKATGRTPAEYRDRFRLEAARAAPEPLNGGKL